MSGTSPDHALNDTLADLVYLMQLKQVLHHGEQRSEAFLYLSTEDCEVLERYYTGHGMPNPDEEDAVEIICAHRRKLEAEEAGIGDRAASIVQQLEDLTDETGFLYLDLRNRVLTHMVDHQDAFHRLRSRDLQTLNRYFLIEDHGEAPGERAVLFHSQTVEGQEPGIRERVLKILAKVKGFEPQSEAEPAQGRKR
jgi:hypothetical protein